MPPFKIKEFHHEVLEAGRLFDSLSSMDFDDAESVSKGVAHVARSCRIDHFPR